MFALIKINDFFIPTWTKITIFTALVGVLVLIVLRRGHTYFAVFVKLIVIIAILFCSFVLLNSVVNPTHIRELARPIYGQLDVLIKNRITRDKKYYWLQARVNWRMNKLNRSGFFKTEEDIMKHMNETVFHRYAERAITEVAFRDSRDFFSKKETIENEMRGKMREYINNRTDGMEDVDILNVDIVRFKTFPKKYEEKDIPQSFIVHNSRDRRKTR